MAFSEFTDYLQLEKNYAPNTLKAYKADLLSFQTFISHNYEGQEVLSANYSQVRSWIVEMVDNGTSNRSINRKLSSLKAYYRFLQKTKQIEASPLARHQALKTPKKIQVPFSEKEVAAVLDSIDASDFNGLRDKLIVELFYSTGLRRIELIGIRLKDVDLAGRSLKVLGKRSKERYIPLIPPVVRTLEMYLQQRDSLEAENKGDCLFLTEKGSKLSESFVYRIINSYFSRVSGKIKKSPHILRHSFATHLLNKGANLNAVKELLGHSSLAATQVYTHNNITELSKIHQVAHPRNKRE